MTEVQIDSSQLPPVQDVCRDFAVLEDGALAYCLQEQEIEQHYASNIQKNQLVQRDIRIAKKLQDVEEEESRLQASEEQKQIEENDSKIAHAIQEDIRRQAEESRRREERDQEIAKWLQNLEEEESCQQKQRRRSLARTRERSSSSHHPNNPRVLDRGQEGAREDGCFCPPMTQYPPQAVDYQTGPCEQSRMRAPWPQNTEGPLGSLTLDWPANISRDIAGGTRCPSRHSASLRVYCTKTGRGGEAPGRRPTLPSRGREHGDCTWAQSSSAAKTRWRQHPRDKSLPLSLGSGCHIEHLSRGSKRRPVPEESQSSLHHAHRPAKEGIQDLCSDDGVEPLSWTMAELDLQNQKQLQQDEELAQRLQEEEQARVKARQNQERHDDYRAAQVAQDEEIARYMQDQELKAQWSSLDKHPKAESIEEAHSLPGRRPSRSQESYQKGALKNCEAASLLRVQPLDRSDVPTRGGPTSAKPQLCRNIAEDLDPTFQAKRTETPTADQAVLCSQGAGPAHPVPVDGFFDYLDDVSESTFVSPTKRQPEKVGRQKSKEKKEGCKQQ